MFYISIYRLLRLAETMKISRFFAGLSIAWFYGNFVVTQKLSPGPNCEAERHIALRNLAGLSCNLGWKLMVGLFTCKTLTVTFQCTLYLSSPFAKIVNFCNTTMFAEAQVSKLVCRSVHSSDLLILYSLLT